MAAKSPTSTTGEHREAEAKVEEVIGKLYDSVSKFLEEISGDHFHLGFYDSTSTKSDSLHSAQTRMIEAALRFASVSDDPPKKPKNILDVGCGIGGSSRYLASKYGAQCKGITLSPYEVERARVLTADHGLESQVSFELADAVQQPFPGEKFDLIWCIDCADHIPDKAKFVQELSRVAAPGATIILLTWCHRDLSPFEQDLHPDERELVDKICSRNHTKWCSAADYMNLMKAHSLQDIKFADWSQHVAPHYAKMRKLTLSWKGITSYIQCVGWKHFNIKVLIMPSLFDTLKNALVKYCILTCKKPE